ncbi:hypothetical protein [Brevibacterium renqingii]|uniref:hypothetical protein n=1 Tax=Brevibacterium renqingii TaxID=2776916 RepID=UPI001ADF7AFB|nr:hypothetical protein [Brevibacterium renqingii]
MSTTSPRLVTWENGTDLVIEMPLALDVERVWDALTDSASVRTWFAPFRLGEEPANTDTDADNDADADTDNDADAPAARPITFELEDVELTGTVLSCETCDHVLFELEGFGVLGIRLVPLDDDAGQGTSDAGQGTSDAGRETLLVFTQTAADADAARTRAEEFGPMWDTHLRLFARTLGAEVAEMSEPELDAVYSNLELETAEAES